MVAGVRDDQLTDPTPCAGTSVAALLDHLVGLTLAFREAAEKVPQSGGPRADADNLPPDWRTRLPQQLDGLVAAWQQPSAWDGSTIHPIGLFDPRRPALAMSSPADDGRT